MRVHLNMFGEFFVFPNKTSIMYRPIRNFNIPPQQPFPGTWKFGFSGSQIPIPKATKMVLECLTLASYYEIKCPYPREMREMAKMNGKVKKITSNTRFDRLCPKYCFYKLLKNKIA